MPFNCRYLYFELILLSLLFLGSCKKVTTKEKSLSKEIAKQTYIKKTDDLEYKVTEYGVVSEGNTLNTLALQALIDRVNQAGGGTLVFPAGQYLSGSLEMKSNVSLYLKEGAVLLGSTNPYDYKEMAMEGKPESPKKDDNSQMAFLVAYKANDFKIYGRGKIDGQGRELALAIDSLHHTGERIDPKYNYRRMRPNETARPKLFRFSTCKNVEILDLDLYNGILLGTFL